MRHDSRGPFVGVGVETALRACRCGSSFRMTAPFWRFRTTGSASTHLRPLPTTAWSACVRLPPAWADLCPSRVQLNVVPVCAHRYLADGLRRCGNPRTSRAEIPEQKGDRPYKVHPRYVSPSTLRRLVRSLATARGAAASDESPRRPAQVPRPWRRAVRAPRGAARQRRAPAPLHPPGRTAR